MEISGSKQNCLDAKRYIEMQALLSPDHAKVEELGRGTSSTSGSTTKTTATSPPEEAEALAEASGDRLRLIMRRMPHSVVVITSIATYDPATDPVPEQSKISGLGHISSDFRAMTVSSLTTITLSPVAVISFNIRKPSRTLSAIEGSGDFYAHILSASPQGAAIADAFTKGGEPLSAFERLCVNHGITVDLGIPMFKAPTLESDAVLARFRCKLMMEKTVHVGDHVIVVAEVLDIVVPKSPKSLKENGLMYVDGAYKHVGAPIALTAETSDDGRLEDQDETTPSRGLREALIGNPRRGDFTGNVRWPQRNEQDVRVVRPRPSIDDKPGGEVSEKQEIPSGIESHDFESDLPPESRYGLT
ncbi:flavin reductase like domain-containing protein [Cryomyces antarcticus]